MKRVGKTDGESTRRSAEGDNAYEEIFRCSRHRCGTTGCTVLFIPDDIHVGE